jgi:hypothetical protein
MREQDAASRRWEDSLEPGTNAPDMHRGASHVGVQLGKLEVIPSFRQHAIN